MASIKKITEVEVPATGSFPGSDPVMLMAAGGFLKGYPMEFVLCNKIPSTTTQVKESGVYLLRTGGHGENGYVYDAPIQTTGWHTMICAIGYESKLDGFELMDVNGDLYFRHYKYGTEGGWKQLSFTNVT